MTYQQVLDLTGVFLAGDFQMPKEPDKQLVSLQSAYFYAADQCTALKLLTTNKGDSIMRMGPGDTYVRMPKLPRDVTDKLDIDSELGPAIARIIASYYAKDIRMKDYHEQKALEYFRKYEEKVMQYLERQESEGAYDVIR